MRIDSPITLSGDADGMPEPAWIASFFSIFRKNSLDLVGQHSYYVGNY